MATKHQAVPLSQSTHFLKEIQMQNAATQTTILSTATTDVVKNDVAQGGNFNLNGAAVIANGVQISEASQKVVSSCMHCWQSATTSTSN